MAFGAENARFCVLLGGRGVELPRIVADDSSRGSREICISLVIGNPAVKQEKEKKRGNRGR